MSGLARWCFRHRRWVVAAWLLAMVAVVGLGKAAGTDFGSSFSLPNTDSQAAVTLLTQNFPAASGEGDQIVIQAADGLTVRSAPVRTAVTEALAKVAAVPGVESVASPYAKADPAHAGGGLISRDGTIAFAVVTWDKQAAQVSTADASNLINAAESADSAAVHISLSGQSITNSERPSPGFTVGVGVIAALAVLLVIFGGAVLAALLPLLGAGLALILGTSLIGLLSHAMSISSVSTELAVLIGLGVGVDYGLFIISRYRSAVKQGMPYADAAALAVATSGRTVLLAGLTVCIALLGQFLLGVSFLYGVSVSAAVAVALTMATALTLLPAMLGFLGPRVLSRRERAARATRRHATPAAGGFWLRLARFVEARKVLVALGSLAAVAAIALPIFGLRLGTSDASTDPAGSTTHQAYTALAEGFGPGFNGPLELVAQADSARDLTAFDHLLGVVAHTSGVATVSPAVTSPNGKVLVASVYPATSPQAGQTVNLVNALRDHLIPRSADGTSLVVHVGGETATNIDFAHVLTAKLPIFIAIVVLLAFLLLMAVFRSLLIPLVASVMNLLSVGAALGAMNAVFSWGWGGSLLGLSGTGPVDAFLPVLIFSVLFGLSMDYEVYLISRIQEEWRHGAGTATGRNHAAVSTGLAKSGPVIAAAAGIMILVFGSFMFGGARELAEFGFGLAFSVLVDALLIRSLLVPALMHIIGPVNWALPRWLDRMLPRLAVEAAEPAVDEAGARVLVGDALPAGPGHTAPNSVIRD
ncbi:MAG: MMPL family transporter [Trebonia sp.]|jgi:RND superfamily putative drug exporter